MIWCKLLPVLGVVATLACIPPSPQTARFPFNDQRGEPVAVAGQEIFELGVVTDGVAGKAGCHAPALTALPDGELLAAWYSYDGPHELDGSAIYMARRPADGDWSAARLHVDHPAGDGNPVLYSEGRRVWLFQAVVLGGWSTARIVYQTSDDGGATWSGEHAVPGPIGANVRFPPIRLSTGELLLPAYNDLWGRSLFYHSPDGLSWRYPVDLATPFPHANQNIQPSVVELRDGRVLAAMRNIAYDWLWVSISDDGGEDWTAPQDSGLPNPGSPAQLLRLASGNLALIFNDSGAVRRPLSIALSADEGRSWPHRRALVDGEGAYSYPTAVQTPDGRIHVAYSHDRRQIGHVTLSEAWIAGG